jgi:hypothetical protein
MRKFELILMSAILVAFCDLGFAQTNLLNIAWEFATTDSLFTPYTDVDEWRDEPVRPRYIHGGFEGTETHSFFQPGTYFVTLRAIFPAQWKCWYSFYPYPESGSRKV